MTNLYIYVSTNFPLCCFGCGSSVSIIAFIACSFIVLFKVLTKLYNGEHVTIQQYFVQNYILFMFFIGVWAITFVGVNIWAIQILIISGYLLKNFGINDSKTQKFFVLLTILVLNGFLFFFVISTFFLNAAFFMNYLFIVTLLINVNNIEYLINALSR